MIHRFKRSDESGFALAELLISLVVTAISTAMVATCIAGMIQVNKQVVMTTDAVNESARIEALYRDDVANATALTLNNTATAPGFTTVTSDLGTGGCRTTVWQFAPQSNPQIVRNLTVSVEVDATTSNRSDGTPFCSGQALSNQTTTLATRVFNPVITYSNLGGQVGTPATGATGPVLTSLSGSGTPAAGVSAATWSSTTIGAMELTFGVQAVGDTTGNQTQTADFYESLAALSTPYQYQPTDFVQLGNTALY